MSWEPRQHWVRGKTMRRSYRFLRFRKGQRETTPHLTKKTLFSPLLYTVNLTVFVALVTKAYLRG